MDKPTTTGRPGRPAFKATTAQRNAVAVGAGAGLTHEMLAAALGIDRSTLTRCFRRELSAGAAAKRLEVVRALYVAAKRGHVAAAKAYLLLGATPAVPRVPAKGKKEQAQIDADEPITDPGWAGILQ